MSQSKPRCVACGGYRLVIGDDKWDCLDCDEKEAADPLLSIRKSRLEAALREVFKNGREWNAWLEHDARVVEEPMSTDQAVARALTELEQA